MGLQMRDLRGLGVAGELVGVLVRVAMGVGGGGYP
jgi:hypothetical protein